MAGLLRQGKKVRDNRAPHRQRLGRGADLQGIQVQGPRRKDDRYAKDRPGCGCRPHARPGCIQRLDVLQSLGVALVLHALQPPGRQQRDKAFLGPKCPHGTRIPSNRESKRGVDYHRKDKKAAKHTGQTWVGNQVSVQMKAELRINGIPIDDDESDGYFGKTPKAC